MSIAKKKTAPTRETTKKQFREMVRIVEDFLKAQKWNYRKGEENGKNMALYNFGLADVGELKVTCHGTLSVEADCVQSFLCLPAIICKQDVKALILEYLARANYVLRYGGFEMEIERGIVRYHLLRSYHSIKEERDETMRQLLFLPVAMIAKYEQGLYDVVDKTKTPIAAFEAVK